MKIRKIKVLKVNSTTFNVKWDKDTYNGSFSYLERTITIGLKETDDNHLFMLICHEIMEIVAIEMNVRLTRPDCNTDYIFVYDHRQHDTIMDMFSGLVSQFII